MIEIQPAVLADVAHVAHNIHPLDAREIKIVTKKEPWPALGESFDASRPEEIFAVHPILDGRVAKPVAIFGCIPDKEPHVGIIWLVSTPMLLTSSKDMLKKAPAVIKGFLAKHPKGLHNMIALFNERHLKWVQKLGAVFARQSVTIEGEPFAHFLFRPEH